jgi:hypothetical protein
LLQPAEERDIVNQEAEIAELFIGRYPQPGPAAGTWFFISPNQALKTLCQSSRASDPEYIASALLDCYLSAPGQFMTL